LRVRVLFFRLPYFFEEVLNNKCEASQLFFQYCLVFVLFCSVLCSFVSSLLSLIFPSLFLSVVLFFCFFFLCFLFFLSSEPPPPSFFFGELNYFGKTRQNIYHQVSCRGRGRGLVLPLAMFCLVVAPRMVVVDAAQIAPDDLLNRLSQRGFWVGTSAQDPRNYTYEIVLSLWNNCEEVGSTCGGVIYPFIYEDDPCPGRFLLFFRKFRKFPSFRNFPSKR
jgi:hypothetical protein